MSGQSHGQSGLAGDGPRVTAAVREELPDAESGGPERVSRRADAIDPDYPDIRGQPNGGDWD